MNYPRLKKPITVQFHIPINEEDINNTKNVVQDELHNRVHIPSGFKVDYLGVVGAFTHQKNFFTMDHTQWEKPCKALLEDVALISMKIPNINLNNPLPYGDYDFKYGLRDVKVCSSIREKCIFVIVTSYSDLFVVLNRLRSGSFVRNDNSYSEFDQLESSYNLADSEKRHFAHELWFYNLMFFRLVSQDGSIQKQYMCKFILWLLRKFFQIDISADNHHFGGVKIKDLKIKTTNRH